VSFPSNQSDHVSPPGTSSISAEIAYGHGNPLPVSKEKLADRVIDELISLNILKNVDEIVYLDTIDIKYAYVIFDKERKPAVQKIHKYLKTIGIIPCGRYGIWAYLWSDEAILSGKKAVEILHKMQLGKS
jgi:UDP-galactopyranose mutase